LDILARFGVRLGEQNATHRQAILGQIEHILMNPSGTPRGEQISPQLSVRNITVKGNRFPDVIQNTILYLNRHKSSFDHLPSSLQLYFVSYLAGLEKSYNRFIVISKCLRTLHAMGMTKAFLVENFPYNFFGESIHFSEAADGPDDHLLAVPPESNMPITSDSFMRLDYIREHLSKNWLRLNVAERINLLSDVYELLSNHSQDNIISDWGLLASLLVALNRS
jgi:hypothetical protein